MPKNKKSKSPHVFRSGDLFPREHYFRLVNGIKSWLSNSVVHYSKSLIEIQGVVSGENFEAQVTIGIEPRLRISPPHVTCDKQEEWVYRSPTWHCSSNGKLCWVLPEEWREIQGWIGKKSIDVVDDATLWLKMSVTNLLERHWVGKKWSMPDSEWPEEWEDWEHYSKGVKQYFSEKQKQKNVS